MDYKGDKYYLDLVLSGNRNAYAYVIDRHKDNVYSLALKICGNIEDAEEVAQDSFMKAYRSLKSFRSKSSFATWIYRIVYNTAISHLRSNKAPVLQLEDFPADSVDFLRDNENEESAKKEYRRTLLNFALQKLKADDRALISMYYFQELSLEEMSGVTAYTKTNLKVKLFRARQRMQEIIIQNKLKEGLLYETA